MIKPLTFLTRKKLHQNNKKGSKDRIIAQWVWREFLRSRLKYALLALFFMIIEALSVGGISYLVRPFFDDLYAGGGTEKIVWVAIGMTALFFSRGLAHFFSQTILNWQAKLINKSAQEKILRHLYSLDQFFFQEHGPGELISRVKGDTQAIRAIAFGSALWGRLFQAIENAA